MEDCANNHMNLVNRQRITVAVITFNQGKKIFSCIDSILNQTYQQIDLVVVDDNSCDFDAVEVERYIRQKKTGNIKSYIVKYLENHCNTVAAYRYALELSQGEYILFVSGDDQLVDEHVLEKAAEKLRRKPVDILQGYGLVMCANGEITIPSVQCVNKAVNREFAELYHLTISEPASQLLCLQAGFFRTAVLLESNVLSNKYKYSVDWLLYTLLLSDKICFSFTNLQIALLQNGGAYRAESVGNVYIRRSYLNEAAAIIRNFGIKQRLHTITAEESIALEGVASAYEYWSVRIYDWGYYSPTDRFVWRWKNNRDIVDLRTLRSSNKKSKISLNHQLFVLVAVFVLWAACLELPIPLAKNIIFASIGVYFLQYLIFFSIKDGQGRVTLDFCKTASFLACLLLCAILIKFPALQISDFLWYLLVSLAGLWCVNLLRKISKKWKLRSAMNRIRKRWQ